MCIAASSCRRPPPPRAKLVSSVNLIIQRYINLGSIKFSLINISGSARSEFTCCSSSFARALVIGPILTSLDVTFAAAGVGVGMSSSAYQIYVKKDIAYDGMR
jgi:hypothetical protein